MKLRLKDKVMVITGRDRGKTGEVIGVLPARQMVVVEGVNMVKKHRKPTQQDPRGGIVELTLPLAVSKVQVIDPKSGKPARIHWKLTEKGTKERQFVTSRFSNKKTSSKDSPATQPKAKPTEKKS